MSSAVRATYVEIPAIDLDRAVAFYAEVFGASARRTVIDGHPAAVLDEPTDDTAALPEGALIALMTGESYEPALAGTRVYVTVDDVPATLAAALARAAVELYPATTLPDGQTVAEFTDSEGNRLAVSDR